MISIKEYAKSHGVSYEAIRQQVVRYTDKEVDGFRLADHISRVGRTQYIDDEGAAFLDERRSRSPIVIQQEERDETIERLRNRVDELQARLITAQDEYRTLIEEKHKIELREQALLADKQMIEAIKEKAAQAESRAEEAETARERAEEEAEKARAEAAEAEKSAEDARSRAERMESAGLIARIFRSW